MNKTALIVFQKNELLGKVKTRLAATLGNEEALRIYKLLISHTHQAILPIEADKYIFYSDFIPELIPGNAAEFFTQLQSGEDLGERMRNGFDLLFSLGYKQVLIIGTDCAALASKHIKSAIQKLKLADVVVGPAVDGGYYLLGMTHFIPALFEDIVWSTSEVFQETINKLNKNGLSYDTIVTLSDIDREEDWEKVKRSFK